MKIAVEGCAHGELDKIYECIVELQRREGIQVDLLICCGDFQAVRNNNDLRCMAVPDKFKNICTFYKYYSGEKLAPVLTLFIGGNHEASNYLQELPYGGWVAPRIYYLGRAGVVRFGQLRIAGMSGIFKGRDYLQGLWESPPYTSNSLRSVYHVRALDVFRLKQLGEPIDVMLSHDWPRGITNYGDRDNLLKRKPFFREDIESNQLGSLPAEELLHSLKPQYWFAAHLHCQFAAVVPHHDTSPPAETRFLALDKCLPRRRHLQLLDVPADGDLRLRYDAEWLAVLRSTNHLLTVRNVDCHLPGPGANERYNFVPSEEEKAEIVKLFQGDLIIPEDSFVKTAPVYVQGAPAGAVLEPLSNPQTVHLCETLGIDDPLQVLLARTGVKMRAPHVAVASSQTSTVTPIRKLPLHLPSPTTPIVMDSFDSNGSNITECVTPAHKTPNSVIRKLPLSLPSPTTPIVVDSFDSNITDNINITATTEADSTAPTETTIDSSFGDTSGTPTSGVTKKTFKRRNQSIYTPGVESDVTRDNAPSSVRESDTPKSTKIPFRRNEQL